MLKVLMMVLLLVGGGASTAAAALSTDEARGFIQTLAERAINGILRAEVPEAEKAKRMRDLVEKNADLDLISRVVLSRHWRTATEQQRGEFRRLFEDVLFLFLNDSFKEYQGQEIQVANVTPGSAVDEAFVTTAIKRPGTTTEPVEVTWRVKRNDNGLKVVDFKAEGVSMLIKFRDEYDGLIRRGGGVDALLSEMRRILDQNRTVLDQSKG